MMKKLMIFSALAMVAGAVLAAPALAGSHEASAKEHMSQRGKEMFKKRDLNGDGVISKEEALKAAEERFNKADANGDGEVSQEEAKAMGEAHRKKMQERHEKYKERKESSSVEE